MDDLRALVAMIDANLADLDVLLRDLEPADLHLADALACREVFVSPTLGLIRERLDTLIGEALGAREATIPGVGVVRRHRRRSRTSWDRDALLRDVMDSRYVDPRTGEIRDETPLDRVLHVWHLGAPRVTALRDRGLDPDDYCTVEERPGWTIEVIT